MLVSTLSDKIDICYFRGRYYMKSLIQHLQEELNISINNPAIIKRAFYHTSYINEQSSRKLESNERLEFLGDAVLELIVSQYLYVTYPQESEGKLTKLRAQLVREPTLAYLARSLHLERYILLGKGEASAGGNQRDSILSDCFEAFLGAVYLDSGMETAYHVLKQVLLNSHIEILGITNKDHKTTFQELAQQSGNAQIEYQILDQTGPAHNQTFTAGLFLNQKLLAQGTGKNKKEAEMQAAKKALADFQEKGSI